MVYFQERESDRRRIQRMREDSMSKGGMGDNDMGRGMMGRDPGRGMMDSGMMSGGMGNMGGGMGNMGGGMGGGMPAAQTPNIPGINPQLLQQLGIEGPVTTQVRGISWHETIVEVRLDKQVVEGCFLYFYWERANSKESLPNYFGVLEYYLDLPKSLNWGTRALFQYKDGLSKYGDFHCKDKTVMRPSYLYSGNSNTG